MDTVALNFEKRKTFDTGRLLRSVFTNHRMLMILGCLFIGIVSIYDTYLVVIEPNILAMEKNPICTRLIKMDPDSLSYFIAGKMAGTLVVISVLSLIHHLRYSGTLVVTGGVVAFQAMLLIYLHLSDPRIGGLPNFALLFQG
jgi:hypothetical protein